MKKTILIITALLLLSACNIPNSAEHTQDLIGTAVAVALTNAPTNTPILFTPAPPTAQPIPPTETATSVPTETPTATPTPTPTLNPQDPALQYGTPDKVENFSTVTGAWNYEDDWSSWNVHDGFLNIYSKGTPYWHSWYTTGAQIKNFYLEAELTMPNCSGKDRIGLVFRLTEGNRFYFMGLTRRHLYQSLYRLQRLRNYPSIPNLRQNPPGKRDQSHRCARQREQLRVLHQRRPGWLDY